jgi:hypothetical protein
VNLLPASALRSELKAAHACGAGHGFASLHERRHPRPGGPWVIHAFAALAEFIRELIVENTEEGLAAARFAAASASPKVVNKRLQRDRLWAAPCGPCDRPAKA